MCYNDFMILTELPIYKSAPIPNWRSLAFFIILKLTGTRHQQGRFKALEWNGELRNQHLHQSTGNRHFYFKLHPPEKESLRFWQICLHIKSWVSHKCRSPELFNLRQALSTRITTAIPLTINAQYRSFFWNTHTDSPIPTEFFLQNTQPNFQIHPLSHFLKEKYFDVCMRIVMFRCSFYDFKMSLHK